VYHPGLLKKRKFTASTIMQLIVKLAVAFIMCLVLFGFPVSIRTGPPVLAVLYCLSFVGAVFFIHYILGSVWFHTRRWTFTLLLQGSVSRKVFNTLREAYVHRAYRTEASPASAILIACPIFAFYWWSKTPIALVLGVFVVYNCIIARALRMYLPPTVLFLTTSAADTIELHAHMTYHFHFFRIVQLLKGDKSSHEFQFLTRRDCYRTMSEDVWEKLVKALIEVCPIVVLDARQTTPGVLKEARYIAKIGINLSHKLVILIGEVGQRPLLDKLGINTQKVFKHEVLAVREAGLLTLMEHLFTKFRKLPTDDHPLADIIRSSEWEFIDRSEWASKASRRITEKS
jgi:hypothetical protein